MAVWCGFLARGDFRKATAAEKTRQQNFDDASATESTNVAVVEATNVAAITNATAASVENTTNAAAIENTNAAATDNTMFR